MSHFCDSGRHCSDPYCRQKDLLPTTCDACGDVFCADHFKYADHSCPKGRSTTDQRVIVCPTCAQAVPCKASEDVNEVLKHHAMGGTCRAPPVPLAKPRCPVSGCKEKLATIMTFSCGRCKQKVCLKHRFEDAHGCEAAAAAAGVARPCREMERRGRGGRGLAAGLLRQLQVMAR